MDASSFKHLLSSHAPISQNETEELSVLLQQYPYLQSARALQLKGFKTNFDTRYNQQLKITAAYTTDRSVLFDYITSNDFVVFVQKEISSNKIIEIEKSTTSANILNDEISSNIDDEEIFNNSVQISTAESQLEIGQPLTFEKNDTFSFNEWLQLAALKPIDRNEKTDFPSNSTSTKKDIQSSLIDHFISTNPKIKSPDKNNPVLDIAEKGVTPNESLMTETLARIYLEQKKYENAIKAYKILSLKYPEKSGYFADQIKAIKKIQNNNLS
ncbi:MAG: hypothetical protein Q8J84_05290 [Flavobacteriaceae bacterium]|nr:hypothetical protein [Flavobacteriaceae bacterium]